MRIDLHTHSDRSDGTTTPRDLVRAARDARLDVVALTDHDTAEGWAEAMVTAEQCGLTLVPGMEISCKAGPHGVHLLAYLCDPAYPPLVEALAAILDGRDQRLPRICSRLRAHGIDISEADVVRVAGSAAALGRPHVADTLVALGVVGDRSEAFDRFLSPGGQGYVQRYAPPVEDMIGLVAEAGGVTVLAHPWGRGGSRYLREETLSRLRDLGLLGVEVDHQDHPPALREELRAVARSLGLVVTGSSDYHGAGKVAHDLGCNLTAPAELERLLDAADRASAKAGGRGARPWESYGARARSLPAPPRVVWRSLTEPSQPGARPWLVLLDDEVAPLVVTAAEPDLVVWSSLWPSRPRDQVRIELASDGTGGTRVAFTLLTRGALPDASKTGHVRRRINELLFADLRYSYGQ